MVSCNMASFSGAGMSGFFQLVLGGKTARQVGIVEDGEAGRVGLEHLFQGVMEALPVLVRQTVDEIQIGGAEPQLAGPDQHGADEVVVLLPIDRDLDPLLKS